MRLSLKDVRLHRLGEQPRDIGNMRASDYLGLIALVELDLAENCIVLVNQRGRWMDLTRFCVNLKQLRDWLAIPDKNDRQFATHVIGGYVLNFRLEADSVLIQAHSLDREDEAPTREVIPKEEVFEALRDFKRQLRVYLIERVDQATANHVWQMGFTFGIERDPYV